MKKPQIKELDKLWQALIKARDGYCKRCGSTKRLAGHHIRNKGRYRSTRWDTLNGIALCFYHHRMAHDDPSEFTDWVMEYMGKTRYELLKYKANKLKLDLDYETVKFALEHALKELNG